MDEKEEEEEGQNGGKKKRRETKRRNVPPPPILSSFLCGFFYSYCPIIGGHTLFLGQSLLLANFQ